MKTNQQHPSTATCRCAEDSSEFDALKRRKDFIMGKGSKWDLQKVKADAVEIGKKLLDQTQPQAPASTITNAEARWLVTWVEVLVNEWPKPVPPVTNNPAEDAFYDKND